MNKIYLIGGVTRSGKSTLAKRILEKYGIAYVNLDHLMMALLNGPVNFGFEIDSHGREISEKSWPMVEAYLQSIFDRQCGTYLIEGALLEPKLTKAFLEKQSREYSVCFLGYNDCAVEDKKQAIRTHATGSEDWTTHVDDDVIEAVAAYGVNYSKEVEALCLELGINYVNTGTKFESQLNKAEDLLIK